MKNDVVQTHRPCLVKTAHSVNYTQSQCTFCAKNTAPQNLNRSSMKLHIFKERLVLFLGYLLIGTLTLIK